MLIIVPMPANFCPPRSWGPPPCYDWNFPRSAFCPRWIFCTAMVHWILPWTFTPIVPIWIVLCPLWINPTKSYPTTLKKTTNSILLMTRTTNALVKNDNLHVCNGNSPNSTAPWPKWCKTLACCTLWLRWIFPVPKAWVASWPRWINAMAMYLHKKQQMYNLAYSNVPFNTKWITMPWPKCRNESSTNPNHPKTRPGTRFRHCDELC
mmetsp:Transcript_17632/g.36523  ORF Transcript_17632/g.36523 Transcript_17632/m.36523 type:complete len:207 (-) Transcript_17632:623-1243(-)